MSVVELVGLAILRIEQQRMVTSLATQMLRIDDHRSCTIKLCKKADTIIEGPKMAKNVMTVLWSIRKKGKIKILRRVNCWLCRLAVCSELRLVFTYLWIKPADRSNGFHCDFDLLAVSRIYEKKILLIKNFKKKT